MPSRDDVMIPDWTALLWISEVNNKFTVSLKDIFEIEEESLFCWPYNESVHLESLYRVKNLALGL